MAETSGFFQAQWDSSLIDPTTGEATGYWDRAYLAQQFADYFKLFIGNGVFGSPTNQLKVIPGTGMSIIVSPGWAYINGYWYHNDTNKVISISDNTGSETRIDSIRLRYRDSDRVIISACFEGDTTLVRGDTVYDLELARVSVSPSTTSITAANITDRRTNESVCGLVKGLLEVETTADLFAQYQAIFNEWFDTVKNQVTGDLAIRLQREFEELNDNVDTYYSNTQQQIDDYEDNVAEQISGYNTNYQQTLNATQQAAQTAQGLVNDYVNNDYVIQEQTLTFTNKICVIQDAKVKATSLIDVYFTSDTIEEAEDCQIFVDSGVGTITLTAVKQPTSLIKAMLRVRVN